MLCNYNFFIRRSISLYTLGLRETRWLILKNMDDWSFQQHQTISTILSHYKNTIVEDILILKQKIRDFFLDSQSQEEAYARRDKLLSGNWHLKTRHFANIMKFLNSSYFKYMTAYLSHPQIPKTTNSENIIRTWRQMEEVRYGFKSDKGRLDHLKLYQVKRYLNNKI
ncbi:MAG: hypothetical protein B1H08_06160 [Candidatus Omnitrophica bacterium 4484_171]|nr:MAG: hypothetical protein B1H08_06160 [Candidatus Omnitrophica bacterium 4484_171]